MPPESAGGLSGLGINAHVFLAQLFNVLIIFLVLRQWAFKPLLKLLEDRRLRVEKAEAYTKEADRRLVESTQEREALLLEAKREAQCVREAVIAEGERLKRETTERARAEGEKMVQQGKAALAREHEQMVRNARGDMATLAVSAAEKILQAEIDHKKADALAAQAIEKLAA